MIKINLPQAEAHSPRLVPSVDIDKVQETGHNLNVIISVGYAAIVNAATYFIVDYISQIKNLKIFNGKLKHYINRTKFGMREFERKFKYEFGNLETYQKNIYLIDCIYDMIEPSCKGIYYAISNELGKTNSEERYMLANMIISAILLHQATTLFDEVLENARIESGYNFHRYFDTLSAKCIEYPFGEAFIIVSKIYKIDTIKLTSIEPVRNGINAIINIMGDENTYRKAKDIVENGEN